MENSKNRKSKRHALLIVVYSLLAALSVTAFSLFLFYNARAREAVQGEREGYTSEIATQLTRNIDNLQNSYAYEIKDGARILEDVKPTSFSQLASLYHDRDDARHFLLTDNNQLLDLSGNHYSLSDDFLAKNIASSASDEVVLSHTTLNFADDYLLFGKKITPMTIDSISYTGVVIGVTSAEFRKNMTISLFNGVGAGYLITEDGAIFIKPEGDSMVFSGFNLFSALEDGGVASSDIEKLQAGMKEGEAKATLTADGIQWMIDIKSTQFSNDYIVVAVPLTLTAASTFNSMTLTVVFAFVFVIALAAIMVIVIFEGSRHKREEDRKVASAAAQTNFLAKMSHDIRTPLNAVSGMLQLASDPRHSRAEVDEFVGKASESANYLLELINGMLDLQKIDSGKMSVVHEPFSMANLLNGIGSMYKPVVEEKGLHFILEGSDAFSGDYLGDEVKVKQILMNLLSNAMKFTPKGGSVTLAAKVHPLEGQKDEVILQVKDTGIGMSEEFMQRMFKPFEQENSSSSSTYVGTGLGLSIVKSLSELMGGSVAVESVEGKGSTFTVSLPFEKSAVARVATPKSAEIVPFNHQKVLLAEDNAINQQIAVLLLKERLALEVDVANNGKEAVDAFNASETGHYAAILLDVRMPVMDGLQAAKAIRASSHPDAKSIPIIALSANTYAEDINQSLKAGMNAHLAKPIDLAEVAAKLHEYIH
jgi:signal transduction histidine kinase/CheY-like chemotaxis protein